MFFRGWSAKILPVLSFVGLIVLLPTYISAQTTDAAVTSGTDWLLFARHGQGLWALNGPPDPLQTEFTADDYTDTYIRVQFFLNETKSKNLVSHFFPS